MMGKRIIVSAVLLWALGSCSSTPEKPTNLIPEDRYITLLIEKQLVRTYTEFNKTDSTKIDSLANAIYEQYDITEEQFQDSHHYYQQFPEEQKKRISRAIEQLKQELVTDQKTDSSTSKTVDDSVKIKKQ
ncbi:protein of unknown function (DUF4296) [Fodinibius salinus]|uniref:DUF4296 domain-containing protein n=1 Tax=Fodinibius salinus TaxID=860790 RepID=A0A5D3YJ08_9BACT|nr:DUF4296 domain-containing protein [Fodinibius salinus]TYP92715.1 protein of unknown function (DUF4296) [Fodinibius salinus]